VLELLGPLINQGERNFQDDINKPNNIWIKIRFTFVVTFVALVVWVVIKKFDNVVLD
jgi:hypothetical protein